MNDDDDDDDDVEVVALLVAGSCLLNSLLPDVTSAPSFQC